ncbi:MAG: hypothetical protein KJ634_12515 [Gammaproteobacteria bacterium]|nr:hypothetical protein [Gammaproteobacteria bacterium]MBU1416437.1 hypothetical protein [Gammaproteobacteria bacterium]
MKTQLTIAAVIAAVTLGTSAYARGSDDRRDHGRDDRGRYEQRDDHWRNDHRRDRWRHNHWRHDHRRSYTYGYGYPPPPRYYAPPPPRATVYIPLPPPPHVVLRELLHGH